MIKSAMFLATALMAVVASASAKDAVKPAAASSAAPAPVTGIRKLGPFGISVADLDRSVRFYSALGFKVGDRESLPHSVAKVLGAESPNSKASMQTMSRDGAEVLLLQVDPVPSGHAADRAGKQLGLAHLEIMVDDVDQVASAIARLGGTVLRKTRAHLTDLGSPNPTDIVFCRDLDGTLIVLVADHEPASTPHPG